MVRGALGLGAALVMIVLGAGTCNAGVAAENPVEAVGYSCPEVEQPPKHIRTQSKYRSDDSSRSSVDIDALEMRDKIVRPIRASVRVLTSIAYDGPTQGAIATARAACVIANLERWAATGSLTVMDSSDAYLSRDRWVAEIALALNFASRRIDLGSHREELISSWLGAIARDTIDAYALRLGPKSRTNNHRYWAGLSVAAIGFAVGDEGFKTWGKVSFDIGACQVDGGGFLPAELARGEKALEYHVYALRPMAALVELAAANGEPLESRCLGGYERLAVQTRKSLKDASVFEAVAGIRQTVAISESSYSSALRMGGLKAFQSR